MSLLKLFARVLVIVLAVSLFQQAHSAQAVPVRPPHFDRRAMPEALAAPVRSPKGDAAKPAPDWRFYVLEYHNFTENASQAADYTMTVSALRRDLDFLRQTAYPLMKGASDFMLKWLIDNPKKPGELITAPSTSPEAQYITDKGYKGSTLYGGTADLAIIHELFRNTIKGAKALNTDLAYQATLQDAINRLHPYQIGKRGNLQEWYYDWDDRDWQHRHQSHLLGLYPFNHITLVKTPEIAAAASKSLEIKGDNSTGWSTGWRICLWARLHRADKSYAILRKLLNYVSPNTLKNHSSGGTYPNLFDAHPPFQIDGNFGGTAGICEMLMQCDGDTMKLLPSLPDAWNTGEINGIKARGNYKIDLSWKNRKVAKAKITSHQAGVLTVCYNGKQKKLHFKAGETKTVK